MALLYLALVIFEDVNSKSKSSILKIPLITTGGTISSKYGEEGALEPTDRDLKNLITSKLVDKGIEISNVYSAYNILSENIDIPHLKILLRELIKVINAEQPSVIVVSHGTDSLDKVVNFLNSEKHLYPSLNQDQELMQLVSNFRELMSKHKVRNIFTASNENDDQEILSNMDGAFSAALSTSNSLWPNPDMLASGSYVYFHGRLLGGRQHVVTDIYDPKIGGMRYNYRRESEYQVKLKTIQHLAEKESAQITKELGLSNQVSYSSKFATYDVNVIRENHDEFKQEHCFNPNSADCTNAVLLTLYHGGTANTHPESKMSVTELIKDLKEQHPGLVFFAVTENYEPVDLTRYQTSLALRRAGVVPLYDMKRETAAHKLRLLAQVHYDPIALIDAMLTSVAGEIDQRLIKSKHIEALKEVYCS